MSYTPPWLTPLGYVLVFAGVVCFFIEKTQPVGPKRGRLKLIALACIGMGIVACSTSALILNQRAPHLTVDGMLSAVRKQGGRGASTSFEVLSPQGPSIPRFSMSGSRNAVVDGETATVVYQAGSFSALRVSVTSGPHAGDVETDSDGTFGAVFLVIVGLAALAYGVINFVSDGTADDPEDNTAPPDGVDSPSLLHLSDKDPV